MSPVDIMSVLIIQHVNDLQQVFWDHLFTLFSHLFSFLGLFIPGKSNRTETHPEGRILRDFSLRICKSHYTLFKIYFYLKHNALPTLSL